MQEVCKERKNLWPDAAIFKATRQHTIRVWTSLREGKTATAEIEFFLYIREMLYMLSSDGRVQEMKLQWFFWVLIDLFKLPAYSIFSASSMLHSVEGTSIANQFYESLFKP